MSRKKMRRAQLGILFLLFCLSFLFISVEFPQNSQNTDPFSDALSDSSPLNSRAIKFPWGDDNGTVIVAENSQQTDQETIPDGMGGVITVWRDSRDGNNDIYAQRIDSDGNILWGGNGTAICTDLNTQRSPTLCTDDNGGAFIAWEDQRVFDYDLYVQHINSTGDVQWTTDGICICSAANDQENPKAARDGQGGAYILWEDDRGPSLDIYAGIGVVVLSSIALGALKELVVEQESVDIMGDLIPLLLEQGSLVEAYLTDAFWYDVGSTERYEKIDNGLIDGLFKL